MYWYVLVCISFLGGGNESHYSRVRLATFSTFTKVTIMPCCIVVVFALLCVLFRLTYATAAVLYRHGGGCMCFIEGIYLFATLGILTALFAQGSFLFALSLFEACHEATLFPRFFGIGFQLCQNFLLVNQFAEQIGLYYGYQQ